MGNKNTDKIQEIINNISGVLLRKLQVGNKEIWIAFIPQITDRDSISNNIIKPLLNYNLSEELRIDLILNSVIYIDDVFEENYENNISNHILNGKTIITLNDSDNFIVANTINIEKRAIEAPQIETSIRSPRDAFTEDLNSNLSLIRHRIKDQSLKIEYITVGSRTKTDVVVIYILDVANEEYVEAIKKKIKDIKIDGVLESAYVQKFISNKDTTFLPQMGIYEKSDSTCANILEGKICIMVDGSNIALIAPKNFAEFFDASDDHYENMYISLFIKMIRFMAFLITLTLSAIYVGIVAYHADIIPAQYITVLAASRITVPVNALTETILMEMVVELLREASARLPKQIGPAIGIVGTIVIGEAAVFAGLVSPLMVIIVALTLMASFAIPDYTIMNSIRLMKFGMILITGFLGIFGFIMGISFIVIKLASISTLGVPYLAPIAPFNYESLKNYFLSNIVYTKKRPEYLKSKDDKRQ